MMKSLIDFWKRDIVNKLIVVSASLLVLAFVITLSLILSLPAAGKSVAGAVSEYFPTATLEPRVLITRAAELAMTQSAAATASVPPTITTMPFAPFVMASTPESTLAVEPTQTATLVPPTPTLSPTPTLIPTLTRLPSPTATRLKPSATPTWSNLITSTPTPRTGSQLPVTATPKLAGTPVNLSCLPAHPPQKGKVLDVLDGKTIKVMIDGFAYVVRYIGVELPVNPHYARLAAQINGDLVFAKEVLLISDVNDKDERGRLLRYVKVGETLPSLELVQKGLLSAVNIPPDSACAGLFKSAEETASAAQLGLWLPTPTFPLP